MNDLISKQAAVKALEETKQSDPFDRYEYQNIGIDWSIDAIKALPSVDAVPVVHGRWVPCHPLGDDTPEGYMCSVCHVGGWEKTNFCPHCGARNIEGDGERKDGEAHENH